MDSSAGVATDASAHHYVLHFFPFSLYTIMTRLTIVLGKSTTKDDGAASLPHIDEKFVNLHRDVNLTEEYLTKVTPKGQVPALTGEKLPAPLTDSLDISYWLCANYYPRLIPSAHEEEIRTTMGELHEFHALPLCVSPEDRGQPFPCDGVDALLARTDISAEYRRALEFKKKFHENGLAGCLSLDSIKWTEDKTRELFGKLSSIRQNHGNDTPWLFGDAGPTVLDAHAASFILRLMDVNRHGLVPDDLQQYAAGIKALPAWDEVMHGRPTVWNVSMGHAHLLDPM